MRDAKDTNIATTDPKLKRVLRQMLSPVPRTLGNNVLGAWM